MLIFNLLCVLICFLERKQSSLFSIFLDYVLSTICTFCLRGILHLLSLVSLRLCHILDVCRSLYVADSLASPMIGLLAAQSKARATFQSAQY